VRHNRSVPTKQESAEPTAHLNERVCERARLARDARFDGRFFIGVTSTRIYCRPICPAPEAKAKNVRYYASAAAAAEAGFRPCLRCRPEASPGTPAWLGASSTVSRALKLIGESALDNGGVDDLADRLGIGSRHLRRLFLRFLGATPVAVAQTRRVHFAKKLIDETSLPMTQIAMAAGFGSIRRFNATFQNLYGRAPGELRKARKGESCKTRADESRGTRVGATDEAGHFVFRLGYRPPYDWAALIGFLAGRAIPGVETVTVDEYRRTISLDGRTGMIAVRPARGNYLELQVHYPEPAALFRIVERVRRIFDVGADPAVIARRLGKDARLKPTVRAHPGLRVPGCWDGFEMAVRAILGQQVSVKGASTMAGRVAAAFGTPTEHGTVFPNAARLADADLSTIGLTRRRAQSISELATAVKCGELKFDGMIDPEDFEEKITGIGGIGAWTAQYIAMRLGEPDAFPATDLYLKRVCAESESWGGGRGAPTPPCTFGPGVMTLESRARMEMQSELFLPR
jgi:AraC family transcriptional regulator, regulatory protein of adaptative response / DNA-3-methyladenine glycosylase II